VEKTVIEFDTATEVLFASRRQLGFGDSLGAEIDLTCATGS